MPETTERRKSTLVSIAYFSVFTVLYYFFIKYAFWLFAPFIIAVLVAMILQKPTLFLSRKTHISKKFWSVVLVLLIVLIILGLLVLVGYKLGVEFYGFGKYVMGKMDNIPALVHSVETRIYNFSNRLPDVLANTVRGTTRELSEKVLSYAKESETTMAEAEAVSRTKGFSISSLATPIGGILSTAKQIPSVLAALLVGIVACFFATSDYEGLSNLIKKNITEEHEQKLIKTKHIIVNVLGKWCKSYAAILFITFAELSLGLGILKLTNLYTGGYIFVIALCTALLDILPVFGTGSVMIPWAVISLFTHKIGLGIGLIVIYAIITVVRQVIEPRLVSVNVGMHPVLTITAMYVGLQLFGFIGLIILPITLVVLKTLNSEGVIHIYSTRTNGPENETDKSEEEQSDNDEPNVQEGN